MHHNKASSMRWLLLGIFGLTGLWFFLLERLIPVPRYWLHTALDDVIPFLPVFIVPYCIWYLYLALPCLYLFVRDHEGFCRLCAFLASGMAIACCVYTLLPNGQPLRPSELGDGPFNAVIRLLYAIDTPTNSAPSLHVIQAIGCHGAIIRIGAGTRRPRAMNAVSLVLLVLIVLSTVFIKQHSVIDLVTGLMVGLVLYFLVYGRSSQTYQKLRLAASKTY